MTVTILDTAARVIHTTVRRTEIVLPYTGAMAEIMAAENQPCTPPVRGRAQACSSQLASPSPRRRPLNHCPERICLGRDPNGKAVRPGKVAAHTGRAPYAGESNRAQSAGGWGQPDPVARRHGRALEHVRRLAVVDDDARAVGVARQGDVLREQAMVVHELELEV